MILQKEVSLIMFHYKKGEYMELLKDIYLVGSGEFGISDSFDCHVYLVDGGDDAVLIDCGVGRNPQRIMDNIMKYVPTERVSRSLVTHVHADHCGGAPFWQSQGIKVWVPKGEATLLENEKEELLTGFAMAKKAEAYPEDCSYTFFLPDAIINAEDIIRVGRYEISTIHVTGHSEGLLCYLLDTGEKRILFCSDYLFAKGSIGLLNCPGSHLAGYRRDIGKLAALEIDVLLPGHRMPVLTEGQAHIDQAIHNLSLAFTPPTF